MSSRSRANHPSGPASYPAGRRSPAADAAAAPAAGATAQQSAELVSAIGDNISTNFQGEFPMPEPTIAQKSPYAVEVEAGKSYFWCACGLSAGQPFCDGSHKGTGFTPVKFEATESKTAYFCGCKHTAHPPLCDGSHKKL
jgi:CDGSH-type Zn-finger protein